MMVAAWQRNLAVGTLIAIWLIWVLGFLGGETKDSVLAKLPFSGQAGSSNQHEELRPLVLYAYSESDNARANLDYFVRSGLHGKADFIFIFNGETDAVSMIPDLQNVRIVQRENTCFDIGAHGEVLRQDDLWKKYKRFITMNASVRGPFIPTWSKDCWTDAFLNKITDKVKLVGTTINCGPRMHLQSMFLATDDIGMGIFLNEDLALSVSVDDAYGSKDDPIGFTACFPTLVKAVHSEIGLTTLIRSQGYDVDVLLTAPHMSSSFDQFCVDNGNPGDFLFAGTYFGANVHPYEIVFMKANRGIDPNFLDHISKWHLAANWTSWDTCGR